MEALKRKVFSRRYSMKEGDSMSFLLCVGVWCDHALPSAVEYLTLRLSCASAILPSLKRLLFSFAELPESFSIDRYAAPLIVARSLGSTIVTVAHSH